MRCDLDDPRPLLNFVPSGSYALVLSARWKEFERIITAISLVPINNLYKQICQMSK
jgi:hypothetical protein